MLDWPTLLRTGPFTPIPSPTLTGKRILITGAGGSLGSALTLCAHASRPASLILLDTSENALYQIDRALTEADSRAHTPILGSVTDQRLLTALFTSRRPEIVLHTAAAKHVPLMEQNPFAAIDINALGTLTLVQTAAAHDAARLLLLLSTDKAADPISIMGASKRLAELAILTTASSVKTTALRLGNVLGTHGSVLPLFEDCIARKLPLPVTHPEATRFFLPLDRAITTLLDALGYDSPTPTLLVSQLDPPVRILDLAQHLLTLHGSSLDIEFTGLRPGDKLHETLLSTTEHLLPSKHPTLLPVATSIPDRTTLQAVFVALSEAIGSRNLPALLQAIGRVIPEYIPSATLLDSYEVHA